MSFLRLHEFCFECVLEICSPFDKAGGSRRIEVLVGGLEGESCVRTQRTRTVKLKEGRGVRVECLRERDVVNEVILQGCPCSESYQMKKIV